MLRHRLGHEELAEMIELNLLEKKQSIKLPSVLGVDLNDLNFKMIAFSVVIFYIPEIFIRSHFDQRIESETESLNQITRKANKLKSENSKNGDIKGQLEAYNNQVEKLKERSHQVDEILKIRTNPKKILEKVARSIPDDLWFESLVIDSNKEITIQGGSYTPRSIGEFITIINDSPFFGNSITPTKQELKQETLDGVLSNYETFELKGKIINYDMRSR